ncbi:metallophosphatase family protein [Halorussus salilacus]|uniref:metallophosphoesterase family protein n=1 Tax=Halorussus salilacus TaxID=2953750 RepID=UPI00209EAC2C|nr:metallophosphoesterase family protein [Halorussus salilacus]USZ67792.1 metallophosphatase family protein [Halorussus salilacus]
MQLGVISDVHGNLVALEAVLDDMPEVDALVCLGDVIGYNPWPGECVDRVREAADVVVKGNHERMVETPERYRHHETAYAGLARADEDLTDGQFEWVRSLPKRRTVADDRFRVVHSHPDPEYEDAYVRPPQFPEMRPYLDDYDGLFLGHTHIQHEATIDGRLVLNPGSVGQPRDSNPAAAYAVVDTDEATADLRRVEYDIDAVRERVEELGMPRETWARLVEGR